MGKREPEGFVGRAVSGVEVSSVAAEEAGGVREACSPQPARKKNKPIARPLSRELCGLNIAFSFPFGYLMAKFS
jgi:hypothetical protein